MIFKNERKHYSGEKRILKRFAFIPTKMCDSFFDLHGFSMRPKTDVWVWLEWYTEEQEWNSTHPNLFSGNGAWYVNKRTRLTF